MTKDQYLKTPASARVANMVADADFQFMLGMAFQYFCETHLETVSTNQLGAAAANYRIDGAKKFKDILNTFCLSDITPQGGKVNTLDYTVK